ncbi:MAG: DUF362 domain-containing protein [Candidatus Thorarchaeota archaeon]
MVSKSGVYISRVSNDLEMSVDRLLDDLEGSMELSEKKHICIKPNICLLKKSNTGVTTDPKLVKSIIRFIQKKTDAKISIIESDATINNLDLAYQALGWTEIADEFDVDLINLTNEPRVSIKMEGYVLRDHKIPKILQTCDYLISVPKLKAHEMTGITGTLKNQFGCLPERNKSKYHKQISQVIVDAVRMCPPDLSILDAIISLKGGVVTGTPVRTNLIMASFDPVAFDAACAYLVGKNPKKIRHLRLAAKIGLGSANYELRGDTSAFVQIMDGRRSLIDQMTSLFLSISSRGA